jgi:sugar O-acyltransferase (sialic acid O-acetyltransferase NeuD family)
MLIFGTGLAAECVLSQLNGENVDGVCVDDEYFSHGQQLRGYAVEPFSKVKLKFAEKHFFVATGYKNLNRSRATVLNKFLDLGLKIGNVISKSDSIFTPECGVNNFIMNGACIQPYVSIENNVFIWSGATVCHHVKIGSNVWITAGATIAGATQIGNNVFIGANATIGSGVMIGSNVFIGAGTLVTGNVDSNSVVIRKNSELSRLKADVFVDFLEKKGTY